MAPKMKRIKIGVVGCGNISSIYLTNLTKVFNKTVEVYAVADMMPERAENAQKTYDIPHIMTLDQMLGCGEIDLILNITTPPDHYWVCKKALESGKSVHVEKPLSLNYEQGRELKELARAKGLYLGGAPDTFMGAGIQTCRKLIDDGVIGEPVAATAFMLCHGHESWHPDPEFYYKKGGGPMFDMGPYYLTALVSLMGAVETVAGMTSISFPQRTITNKNKYGNKIDVEVPTHVAGTMKFKSGAIGTIITSFDIWGSTLPRIEVYGSKGTLVVPDPNTFGGPVLLKTQFETEFTEIPLTHGYSENSRGLGVADLAYCLSSGSGNNRAGGGLACHVLEIMQAMHVSAETGQYYKMETCCEKPAAMDPDFRY